MVCQIMVYQILVYRMQIYHILVYLIRFYQFLGTKFSCIGFSSENLSYPSGHWTALNISVPKFSWSLFLVETIQNWSVARRDIVPCGTCRGKIIRKSSFVEDLTTIWSLYLPRYNFQYPPFLFDFKTLLIISLHSGSSDFKSSWIFFSWVYSINLAC